MISTDKTKAAAKLAVTDTQTAANAVSAVSQKIGALMQQARLADLSKDKAAIPALVTQAQDLKSQLIAAHAAYVKQTYVAQIVNAIDILASKGDADGVNRLSNALKSLTGRKIALKLPKPGAKANASATKLSGVFDDIGSAFGAVGGAIGDAAGWMKDNVGVIGGVVGAAVGAYTGNAAIGGAIAGGSAIVDHAVNKPAAPTSAPGVPSGMPTGYPTANGAAPGMFPGGAPPSSYPFPTSGGVQPAYAIPSPGVVPTTMGWLDAHKGLLLIGGVLVAGVGALLYFEGDTHPAPKALPAPAA